MEGTGGGDGDGAALQGSRPSYVVVDAASGFSSTKLPPKLTEEEVPYACVGRGALNIMEVGKSKLCQLVYRSGSEFRLEKLGGG
jgi:hypothetical protein